MCFIHSVNTNQKFLTLFFILGILSDSFIFSQNKTDPEKNFFNRTIKTLENAEAIDNQYRKFIEMIFALLCKAPVDVHTIGDLLEKKMEIFKKNTEKLGFIKEAQKTNLDAYLVHRKQENESNDLETNPEVYYFTPMEPSPLSQIEQKISIEKIIGKNFIGKIPNQVQDIINYFNNYKEFSTQNFELQNIVLLHGKPGVGKSHLVEVIAQALQLPLLSFTGSFFGDKYIGESSKRIRKACAAAKNYDKPIIIFIDEIDALAVKRNDTMHNEHRASLITLLDELQKLKGNKNVIVFAATNDLKSLDDAIKDRFAGTICEIKDLNMQERAQLFSKIFNDHNFSIGKNETSSFSQRLAEVTESTDSNRFSNRDIEYITNTIISKSKTDKNKKNLCVYARQAIDNTGKKGSFSFSDLTAKYCNGI